MRTSDCVVKKVKDGLIMSYRNKHCKKLTLEIEWQIQTKNALDKKSAQRIPL